MRKTLLFFSALFFYMTAQAQRPAVIINSPASVAQAIFTPTFGTAAFGAQLTTGFTPVTGDLIVPVDSIAPTGDGCQGFVTSTVNVSGKIALVDRGVCYFNEKAYHAEAAGAIACIICNNAASGVINMSAGNTSLTNNIPTVMVDKPTCDAIKVVLNGGGAVNVTLSGDYRYNNDVQANIQDVILPPNVAAPVFEATNAGDYPVFMGMSLTNVGINNLSNVSTTATITQNGSNVYTQTSSPLATLNALSSTVLDNDSLVMLQQFDPYIANNCHKRDYQMNYVTSHTGTDDYPRNDSLTWKFSMTDTTFSKVRVGTDGLPMATSAFRSGSTTAVSTEWGSTYFIRYGNGKTLNKVSCAVSPQSGANLLGKAINVNAYEWTDADGNRAIADTELNAVGVGSITIGTPGTALTTFTLDMIDVNTGGAVNLKDNTNYLITVQINHSDSLFIGCDDQVNYSKLLTFADSTGTPIVYRMSPVKSTQWFNAGFSGTSAVPTTMLHIGGVAPCPISVQTTRNTQISMSVSPNPAEDFTTLKLDLPEATNHLQLDLMSLDGRLISSKTYEHVQSNQFNYDVSNLNAGTYYIKATTDKGFNTVRFVTTNKSK